MDRESENEYPPTKFELEFDIRSKADELSLRAGPVIGRLISELIDAKIELARLEVK
jgi:hypothetical protein